MNTADLRKTYESSRGASHQANAVLALCDEVDRLQALIAVKQPGMGASSDNDQNRTDNDQNRTGQRADQIEIRIGNAPLVKKLDVLAATVDAIRNAHRDGMSPKSWAAMGRAQEDLAEAMLHIEDKRPVELPPVRPRLRVT